MNEGIKNLENFTGDFNWREHIKDIDIISKDSISKLDELQSLANDGSEESKKLLSALFYSKGSAVLIMVNSYREILTQEERELLLDEVESAGRKLPEGWESGGLQT